MTVDERKKWNDGLDEDQHEILYRMFVGQMGCSPEFVLESIAQILHDVAADNETCNARKCQYLMAEEIVSSILPKISKLWELIQ